jgi:hypothetical protein
VTIYRKENRGRKVVSYVGLMIRGREERQEKNPGPLKWYILYLDYELIYLAYKSYF